MWIIIVLSLNIKTGLFFYEVLVKFTHLIGMIADQKFYDICFTFFILRLRLRPTAKGRNLSGPNIRLWPKVKIASTVQHCLNSKLDLIWTVKFVKFKKVGKYVFHWNQVKSKNGSLLFWTGFRTLLMSILMNLCSCLFTSFVLN